MVYLIWSYPETYAPRYVIGRLTKVLRGLEFAARGLLNVTEDTKDLAWTRRNFA